MKTASYQQVTDPRKPEKKTFLINRNYRLLFFGQAISVIGDQICSYTLLLWVILIIARDKTWAPLAVSIIMVAGMVPNLLVGPVAGVFVDRWNHRLTMLRMDALRALLTLVLVAFSGILPVAFFLNGQIQFGVLAVVAFLLSVCSQFFGPSYMGLVADVVPEEQRPQAVGYGQTIQSFASIVGPPLAAPLLITLGIKWALIIDVLSYLVSLLSLWGMRTSSVPRSEVKHASVRNEFFAGLHFSFGNATIRMLIITSSIGALGIGAFDALYLFFIKINLHADIKLAGFAGAALGIGTIIGAILAGKVCNLIGTNRMLYGSLLMVGLVIICFSRLTNIWIALGFIFLLGMVIAGLRVAAGPLLLKETPNNMIGRVVSVMNPISTVANLFSVVFASFLISVVLVNMHASFLGFTFGSIDTVFVGVSCMFFLAALYSFSVINKSNPQESASLPLQQAGD